MRFQIAIVTVCALLLACSGPENAPARIAPGFQLSQLTGCRIAVWPILKLESDRDTDLLIQKEYGSREAFLRAFSLKLSGRLVPACQAPSLDSTTLSGLLVAQIPRLNPDVLLKQTQAGKAPELARIPELMGIQYVFLCRSFRIGRSKPNDDPDLSTEASIRNTGLAENNSVYFPTYALEQAQNNPSESPLQNFSAIRTKGVLRMALMDLKTGAVVWANADPTLHQA